MAHSGSIVNVGQIYDSLSVGQSNGTDTLSTYALRVRISGASAGLSVKLVFGNFNQCPDVIGANSITVYAAWVNGVTIVPITFSGNASGSIAAGAILVSDAITITTSDFATFRTCVQVAGGATWPLGIVYSDAYGGGYTNGQNLALAGSGSVGTGTGYGYGPLAVIAGVVSKSIMVRGDSIAHGSVDLGGGGYVQEGYFGTGWVVRAINNSIPFSRWTNPGTDIASAEGVNNQYGVKAYKYFNYGLCEHGVNSLGLDSATIISQLNQLWTEMKANGIKRVAQSTITPTPSNNATRVAVNTYIRSLPSPLDYCIEVAYAVETLPDSGIWNPLYDSGDQTHPSTAGHEAIAAEVGPGWISDINSH